MSKPSRSSVSSSPVPVAPSWLALLASTTLGSHYPVLRVEVQSTNTPLLATPEDSLRLVVQVFSKRALRHGKLLPWARPMASAQRAVRSDALRNGVSVLLTGFEPSCSVPDDRLVVFGWVELGSPDLDLDGANAHPSWDSCTGMACVSQEARSDRSRPGILLRLRPATYRPPARALSTDSSGLEPVYEQCG